MVVIRECSWKKTQIEKKKQKKPNITKDNTYPDFLVLRNVGIVLYASLSDFMVLQNVSIICQSSRFLGVTE